MIALLAFTRQHNIMGRFANDRLTHAAALAGTPRRLVRDAIHLLEPEIENVQSFVCLQPPQGKLTFVQ